MEKLDVELEVIKCKIHEEDLCESFKENLERKLNSKCEVKENVTSKKKNNIIKKPFYFYKAAAVFVCFVMFSSCAFAGGVGDWLKELFSNVDKEMEIAYENGDIKEVETEYQTFDGVSVKVDYVSLKDNELYVVLNVKTEDEYDSVCIKDTIIEDKNSNEIFNATRISNNWSINVSEKRTNELERLIILTLTQNEQNILKDCNTIEINFKNIVAIKNDIIVEYFGDWHFELNIDK